MGQTEISALDKVKKVVKSLNRLFSARCEVTFGRSVCKCVTPCFSGSFSPKKSVSFDFVHAAIPTCIPTSLNTSSTKFSLWPKSCERSALTLEIPVEVSRCQKIMFSDQAWSLSILFIFYFVGSLQMNEFHFFQLCRYNVQNFHQKICIYRKYEMSSFCI